MNVQNHLWLHSTDAIHVLGFGSSGYQAVLASELRFLSCFTNVENKLKMKPKKKNPPQLPHRCRTLHGHLLLLCPQIHNVCVRQRLVALAAARHVVLAVDNGGRTLHGAATLEVHQRPHHAKLRPRLVLHLREFVVYIF